MISPQEKLTAIESAAPFPRCSGLSSSTSRRALPKPYPRLQRSEEHTSELQSQSNIVCRLLLEKKIQDLLAFDRLGRAMIDYRSVHVLHIILGRSVAFQSATLRVADNRDITACVLRVRLTVRVQ